MPYLSLKYVQYHYVSLLYEEDFPHLLLKSNNLK